MDKKYNASSLIYVQKTFNFVICYLVILYYDLDFVLNQVASNGLEVAPFENFLPPQCERACGGPDSWDYAIDHNENDDENKK